MNTFAHDLQLTTQSLRQKQPAKPLLAVYALAKYLFTLSQAFKGGHLHR